MAGSLLVVRADASAQIGWGHVMRCLALAQAWQDEGGNAIFVTTHDAPALNRRLRVEGIQVELLEPEPGSMSDAEFTARVARTENAEWLVLDGYHFDSHYQQAIKACGLKLLCVDDNGALPHYYADVVLNQNLHARETMYAAREPYTRLLLGTRYALLRREFLKWRDWKRAIPDVARRVLVTLGGSDPDNVTRKVMDAIQQTAITGLEAVVVIGASNPHAEELQSVARSTRVPIRLEMNATNMPELMAWADVAISGAGSTCWELAFMGLPSIVITLAENQKRIGEYLNVQGVMIHLGEGQSIQPVEISNALEEWMTDLQRRRIVSRNGRALVDGCGMDRVIQEMILH